MFVEEANFETVSGWFDRYGVTDHHYLKGHFNRFLKSFEIVNANVASKSIILDIGAHWLHQAFFFANAGHRLICADLPATLNMESVSNQAKAMNAKIVVINRLELGGGLEEIDENSVDVILFSEILEHLTFNPIPMWKQLYRLLRPQGRIYISTPNSCYYRTLHEKLGSLILSGEYGISVERIFGDGTYGHHWKEYSIVELEDYFRKLSLDFRIGMAAAVNFDGDEDAAAIQHYIGQVAIPGVDFCKLINQIESKGNQPFGSQILIEVILEQKNHGISIAPPWIPE